jgi:hypothetical protein
MLVSCNNVTSEPTLAISISIVEGYKFEPGETFHTITEIRNSEASGREDVIVTYELMDSNKNVILIESNTVAIETLSSFSEDIKIPQSLSKGVYLLRAGVSSLDETVQSEAIVSFNIDVPVTFSQQLIIIYLMSVALVVTIVFLIYEHKRVSKLTVSGKDLKKYVGQ